MTLCDHARTPSVPDARPAFMIDHMVDLCAVEDLGALSGRVHPNVLSRYADFYTCPRCGTIFWRGSPVRNTCRKLALPPPSDSARGA